MSIKNDRAIFKFDPLSFWEEKSNHKRDITISTINNGKKIETVVYYDPAIDEHY